MRLLPPLITGSAFPVRPTSCSCTTPACRTRTRRLHWLCDPEEQGLVALFRPCRWAAVADWSRGSPRLACGRIDLGRRKRHQFALDRDRDRQCRPSGRPARISRGADRSGDRALPRNPRAASDPAAPGLGTFRRRAGTESSIRASSFRGTGSPPPAIGHFVEPRVRRRSSRVEARRCRSKGRGVAGTARALRIRPRSERRIRPAHPRCSRGIPASLSPGAASTERPTARQWGRCSGCWLSSLRTATCSEFRSTRPAASPEEQMPAGL